MIHIDKNGNVIGSFDAPNGHGMDVDSKGFVYMGQDTVRKYDPKTGKLRSARWPACQSRGRGSGGRGTTGACPAARARGARRRRSSDVRRAAARGAVDAAEQASARPSARNIRRPRR